MDSENDKLVDQIEDEIDRFNDSVPRELKITSETKQAYRENAKERKRQAQQGLSLTPGIRREFQDMIENTEIDFGQ